MNDLCFEVPSARLTNELGGVFATHASTPLVLWLTGELGSGKTTFSRGFIHSLGYRGIVTSPTYTLLELYEIGEINVLHLDLYRLEKADNLLEIGLGEYLDEDSICLIEWPESVARGVPTADVKLNFVFAGAERKVIAEVCSDAGNSLLGGVETQWI